MPSGCAAIALLGRERCPAAVALRIGRRFFIDPLAAGRAVDAGGADIDEAADLRGQGGEHVSHAAGVDCSIVWLKTLERSYPTAKSTVSRRADSSTFRGG